MGFHRGGRGLIHAPNEKPKITLPSLKILRG